jgi:hypothetical protein
MSGVRVQVVRYVDDSQPGWVQAVLRDAWGREWLFVEKIPVLTELHLDSESSYPQPGVIACEVVNSWLDDRGREIRTVETARPYGVEAEGGVSRFDVLAEQVMCG